MISFPLFICIWFFFVFLTFNFILYVGIVIGFENWNRTTELTLTHKNLAMKAHKPTDATTNPSLILSAAQQEQYQHLIERAVKHGNKTGT